MASVGQVQEGLAGTQHADTAALLNVRHATCDNVQAAAVQQGRALEPDEALAYSPR